MDYEDDKEDSNIAEFSVRDSLFILIDGSPSMHSGQPSYFIKSLKNYESLIRHKCCYNKKDRIGFAVYSTTDSNCGIDNVTMVENYSDLTVDLLKRVKKILKDDAQEYELKSCTATDAFYNALNYAYQQILKDISKGQNKIIIFTCNDDLQTKEKQKVEALVNCYSNSPIHLNVVGLKNSWDDDLLYKELQIMSNAFSKDNYERIQIEDIVKQLVYPSRSSGSMKLMISNDIGIDIQMFNLIGLPKTTSKVVISKEDNEELRPVNIWSEEMFPGDDEDCEAKSKSNVENLLHCKTYGQKDICLKTAEKKELYAVDCEPFILIIGFMPVFCDPLYQYEPAHFISLSESCTSDEKAFFMGLINDCINKDLMAIVRVAKRGSYLCSLIPSQEDNGFYCCRMPYKDEVRDLDGHLADYVYNAETSPCPINEEAVEEFKSLIKNNQMTYHPEKFVNPQLQNTYQHLEALACEEKLREVDNMAAITSNFKIDPDLVQRLNEMLNLTDIPTSNKRSLDGSSSGSGRPAKMPLMENTLKSFLVSGKYGSVTVAQLREFLRSVDKPTNGVKSELIDRVKEHFNL